MRVEDLISIKLTEKFNPSVLNIENESHRHSSGRGAESHFKVTMVSTQFEQQRMVDRHRRVYECLADELANGVHALALHLYTEDEWQDRGGIIPKSTNCLGVEK